MNLKGRYDMLRTAALHLVGLPADDVEQLKQLAAALQIPSITDEDAAASLLLVQTLITTHTDTKDPTCGRCKTNEWVTKSSPAGAFRECVKCGNSRFPLPGEAI